MPFAELDPLVTDFDGSALQMTMTGVLTLGGGVPAVRLSRWEWPGAFPEEFPGELEISMVQEGSNPNDRRTPTRTVSVDD